MTVLIKKENAWIISFHGKENSIKFSTIESAAEFMNDYLSIKNDNIDFALIEMTISGHSNAIFNGNGELEETY